MITTTIKQQINPCLPSLPLIIHTALSCPSRRNMRTAATHQLSAASLQLGAPQRAKAPARRNQKRIWAHPRDWNGHVAAGRARWLELHGVLAHAANDVLLRREQRYVHKVERVALRLDLREANVLDRARPHALPFTVAYRHGARNCDCHHGRSFPFLLQNFSSPATIPRRPELPLSKRWLHPRRTHIVLLLECALM